MRYYIVVITSIDYYTLYDGIEIVKAKNPKDAAEKAKTAYIQKEWKGQGDGGFGSYRSVAAIIDCGTTKPKER